MSAVLEDDPVVAHRKCTSTKVELVFGLGSRGLTAVRNGGFSLFGKHEDQCKSIGGVF
jgi:hypothetical protein